MGTVTKGFDARLADRSFLVFDFRTHWHSGLMARVPESQKLKIISYHISYIIRTNVLEHTRHTSALTVAQKQRNISA